MSQSSIDRSPQSLNASPRSMRILFRLGELLVLILLSLYILSGAESVPFHGDEATILYTTRDFYAIIQGGMGKVLYSSNPDAIGPSAQAEQELRLLNGTVARYAYGLFSLNRRTGQPYEPINEQWDWGAGYGYNIETGHMPQTISLNRARTISCLFLIGALWSLYGLARRIGGPGVAIIAALYFTFNPAILINGRRAMMESSWLFFGLLGLAIAADLCERIHGRLLSPDKMFSTLPKGHFAPVSLRLYIQLGGALGLALASKHTSLFYIGAALAAVMLAPLWAKRRILGKHMIGIPLALAVMILVFLVLNPAWWGDPVSRLSEVLRLRSNLLAGQTATFGGYADLNERLAGFVRQAFIVQPQYYEVANWKDFIASEIAAYEASGWQGVSIGGSAIGALAVIGLVVVGVFTCIRALFAKAMSLPELKLHGVQEVVESNPRVVSQTFKLWPSPMGAWVALWMGLAGLGAAITTPLEWQRYYLPLYPAIAIFLGVGIMVLVRAVTQRGRQNTAPAETVISH